MKPNKSIIRKADITVSDLSSNGGYLPEAKAKKFIKRMIRKMKFVGMITNMPLKSHTQKLPNLRFTDEVLQPGVSGQELSVTQRAKPALGEETWNAKLFKAQVDIPEEVLEDNVEGKGLKATIMNAAVEKIWAGIEKVVLLGDTTSATLLLAQLDGLIKQASTNTVAGGSSRLTKALCKQMLRTMPKEYLEDKSKLRIFTSINAEDDFAEVYEARSGVRADRQLENGGAVKFRGVPVIPIPLFPENLGAGTNETVALLTDPKNAMLGWWRKVKVASMHDIKADNYTTVWSMRLDARYGVEDMVVKTTAILNS